MFIEIDTDYVNGCTIQYPNHEGDYEKVLISDDFGEMGNKERAEYGQEICRTVLGALGIYYSKHNDYNVTVNVVKNEDKDL